MAKVILLAARHNFINPGAALRWKVYTGLQYLTDKIACKTEKINESILLKVILLGMCALCFSTFMLHRFNLFSSSKIRIPDIVFKYYALVTCSCGVPVAPFSVVFLGGPQREVLFTDSQPHASAHASNSAQTFLGLVNNELARPVSTASLLPYGKKVALIISSTEGRGIETSCRLRGELC